MTTERENGQRIDQRMDDIVRDADEYYNYLKGKHVHETRLNVAVAGLVVCFAQLRRDRTQRVRLIRENDLLRPSSLRGRDSDCYRSRIRNICNQT